jgi:SNF2 family DNA or RNA helicase
VTEKINDLLLEGKQVVIFTEFIESALEIASRFGVVALTGDTKPDDRQTLVDDFQTGKSKVFVSTHKAGGCGLTLTASQYLFIVDFPWSPGDYQQSCDRIHRIGQNGTCTIFNVYGKDIDYFMADTLSFKNGNIEKVMKKINPKDKHKQQSNTDRMLAVVDKLIS